MIEKPKGAKYLMSIRGEYYWLNDASMISRQDMEMPFSPDWRIYGVASKWNARPVLWKAIKNRLDRGEGVDGYLYDIDHGTVRMWGGQYAGKLPKVRIWRM